MLWTIVVGVCAVDGVWEEGGGRMCCGVCMSENSEWGINCCSFNATLMVVVCMYTHTYYGYVLV